METPSDIVLNKTPEQSAFEETESQESEEDPKHRSMVVEKRRKDSKLI